MNLVRSAVGGLSLLVFLSLVIASCEVVAGVQDTVLSECAPGEKRECYMGPDGTKGVGICKAGSQTCADDGTAFGDCEGQVLPAKEDCSNELDDACSGAGCGQSYWTRSFDTQGDPEAQLLPSAALDSKGNIYVAGHFQKKAEFGDEPLTSESPGSLYVVKLDPEGTPLWSQAFGSGDLQKTTMVRVTPDDMVVVATTPGNGTIDFGGGPIGPNGTAVAQFDGTGSLKWQRAFGGTMGVHGLAVDATSNEIVVAGRFSGSVDLGDGSTSTSQGGSGDIFITKLDGDGNTVWVETFGDEDPAQAADQLVWGVVVDGSSRVVLSGTFGGTLVFGSPVTAQGDPSLFVAAVDASGSPQWMSPFGGASTQAILPFALASAPGGGIVVGGLFIGELNLDGFVKVTAPGDQGDGFIARLDSDGHYSWAHALGDEATQQVVDAAVDVEGNVVVVGGFAGTVDFGGGPTTSKGDADVFMVKYAPTGDYLWSRARGNTGAYQIASTVTIDPESGGIIVAGPNNGTLDFGSGPITAKTDIDLFVTKIAP